MKLLALLFLSVRAWYLQMVVERIAIAAPLHPERIRTERELLETRRRLTHLHRSLG